MAEITDEDWDKLQDFDTRRLLAAVDEVDTLRGLLTDDGIRPPEIRDRLLKLHQLAMAVINGDAQDLDDEVFDILEAVKRLHDTLSALIELRPENLDDDDGDKTGDEE